jgi:hypothetical protein
MHALENLRLQEFDLQVMVRGNKEVTEQLERILASQKLEEVLDFYILRAASGGKDCRAAQMQLPKN